MAMLIRPSRGARRSAELNEVKDRDGYTVVRVIGEIKVGSSEP